MEKFLTIKTPGLFIDIPGIPAFRTPGKINITSLDEQIIEAELKKLGVGKFKITSKVKVLNKQTIKKEVKYQIDNSELLFKIQNQQNSIDKIHLLLENFLTSKESKTIKNKITNKKPKFEVEVEDFIPTINLDKIKSNLK